MIDTLAAQCAYGCTRRGEHAVTCEGECKGCMPRRAEHGLICTPCWHLLERTISDIPALVENASTYAVAVKSTDYRSDSNGGYGDPAERTILHPATLDADELESDVASWVRVILDEHPEALRGPNSETWKGNHCAWLFARLEWCSRQEWIAEMRRELPMRAAAMRAKWPLPEDRERVRPIPDALCPGCARTGLTYCPPAFERQQIQVLCDSPECSRVLTEDEWPAYVARVIKREAA